MGVAAFAPDAGAVCLAAAGLERLAADLAVLVVRVLRVAITQRGRKGRRRRKEGLRSWGGSTIG